MTSAVLARWNGVALVDACPSCGKQTILIVLHVGRTGKVVECPDCLATFGVYR